MASNERETADVKTEQPHKPTLGGLIKTTLFAAVGVQSDTNRERDFSQSSPTPYIIMGVVFTALFIGSLILIAKVAVS